MSDADARRRIREDFGTTLWVEAAAGTGKTSELVRRIVGIVGSGRARLATIAAVTFTEKAAGELKLRLRAELERVRTDPARPADQRKRLDQAVAELETARVGTIHALCADLLRERPIEAGVDPLFEVTAEDEAARWFDTAFERWLQEQVADPPEGVRRLLRRPPDPEGHGPRLQLRSAALLLVERRDFDGPWTRPDFDRRTAIDGALEALDAWASYATRASDPDDNLAKASAVARRWLDDTARRERVRGRDHDGLEVALRWALDDWDWARTGRGTTFGPDLERAEVVEARDRTRRAVEGVVEVCDADLAACLHQDLQSLVARYEEVKARAGRLDYVDLLLRVRELLVRDAGVRRDLQQRFTHLCVDEFQDTDPLQADILLLLAADDPTCADPVGVRVAPGKLFVVGDPKQSIYRFRRADVACYEAVKSRLLGSGAELVRLATSFRSDPRIQHAVNAAFTPRMRGDGQAEYVALEPHRPALEAQPAVLALPVPRPKGKSGKPTVGAVDASLPDAIANFVAWVLERSGWKVTEADLSEPVPVASRHVCLLFHQTVRGRFTDLLALYTRPLEARGIPHALVGGRSFHDRDEVLALRNALQAIEWPDDTLSVYATLKGPLFAVPDHALFLWRERVGSLHPLHRPTPADDDPARVALLEVSAALEVLAAARTGRNRRPIARTIAALLAATRAHAGFAAASSGEQVLANVQRVAQLARRFEAVAPTSFRAFVDWVEEEAERGDAPDAPVVEEGTEGVRLMTVHKAKGLEFPIVVLADLASAHTRREPSRYIDPGRRLWALPLAGCVPLDLRAHEAEVLAEDRREADRLAYVAATRARDVLVVPAIDDGPREGWWLEPLYPAIYPKRGTGQQPRRPLGCPPVDLAGDGGEGVAPGLHVPQSGEHEVVWWEPLGRIQPWAGGLRRHALLEPVDGEDDGELRYRAWREERERRLRSGARATFEIVLATEARGATATVVVEATQGARTARPFGPRFGSMVHAALAAVPFDADGDVIASLVALQTRIYGGTAAETVAAVDAVAAALRHPLLRRAAASPDCRREVPVAWREGERLVEGLADLAFQEDDAWTVVDYKTDEDAMARRGVYEAQVAAYAQGIRVATGAHRVKGVLLFV